MDLDNDPLQDSIQRVLQVAADAHQRPTWSLYRALNETDQRITDTVSNRHPGAYIQELRRDMQNAQQQSPEIVVVQGREIKTGAWTNLTEAPRAKEALAFIQESDAPAPATLEETAAALVLPLHSRTQGHTIVLHDKTGPSTHAPRHADRPLCPRGKYTWDGRPDEKMTSTPWCTPPGTDTGQPRRRSLHQSPPRPPHRDQPPDPGPCTNSWPMPAP